MLETDCPDRIRARKLIAQMKEGSGKGNSAREGRGVDDLARATFSRPGTCLLRNFDFGRADFIAYYLGHDLVEYCYNPDNNCYIVSVTRPPKRVSVQTGASNMALRDAVLELISVLDRDDVQHMHMHIWIGALQQVYFHARQAGFEDPRSHGSPWSNGSGSMVVQRAEQLLGLRGNLTIHLCGQWEQLFDAPQIYEQLLRLRQCGELKFERHRHCHPDNEIGSWRVRVVDSAFSSLCDG